MPVSGAILLNEEKATGDDFRDPIQEMLALKARRADDEGGSIENYRNRSKTII
jgi:hypothetical protein